MNAPFNDLAVAQFRASEDPPLITVAIPHYKQRRFLERVLASLFEQNLTRFEIVVSDDCSPDDSGAVIPELLKASGKSFRYYTQPKNLGYDGNVRFCLAMSLGRYVMLLGNDDALAGPSMLEQVAASLEQLQWPQVAFTDFEDWQTHVRGNRTHATCRLGSGPGVALTYFRKFSFVSGLIYDREWSNRFDTDRWDRSVFYQIYLASRIISAGGTVAAIDVTAVRKDVRVDGKTVDNMQTKLADARWSFASRHSGLDNVIRVTAAAILPEIPEREKSTWIRRIVSQVLTIPYGYWLLEYRRSGNWAVAVGLARGMRPSLYLGDFQELRFCDRIYLWMLYAVVTVAGLIIPTGLIGFLKRRKRRA